MTSHRFVVSSYWQMLKGPGLKSSVLYILVFQDRPQGGGGVVSTVVSDIPFALFPRVEYVPTISLKKATSPLLIHSTVRKRAKRTPDTTVETTGGHKNMF